MGLFSKKPEPSGEISLRESLGILKENAGDYFAARKELLQIEVKEASEVIGQKLVLVVIAAVMAVFTYFLFWLLVIGAVALLFSQWACWCTTLPISALLVLLIHGVGLFIVVKKIKQKPPYPLFEMTKAELLRDKEWVKENR